MSGFRLASGGLIDRARPLNFRFDGRARAGFAGDTLASALIAGGETLFGRSFKYHRPRGVVSLGASEPNALVELRSGARREPNTRAAMAELYDGLEAASQNRWPSLAWDIGAVNQLFGGALTAGFYYKTFMWPKSFWEKIYEPVIRRAAGLGKAAKEPDPDRYEKTFAHCDVLVIGSGPAGLMAALAAGRSGARVVLADEGARFGGSLLHEREDIAGGDGAAFAASVLDELTAMKNVRLLPRTTVFGWYDGNIFGAVERVNDHVAVPAAFEPRQRYWRVIAKRAILCAGAEERPLVFGGNDRPGVMLASSMRGYANRYAAAAGRSVAVFTNNDSGYRTARDFVRHGVHVAAVIDARPGAKADSGGAPVIRDQCVVNAAGARAVSGVELSGHGRIPCDALAMSGGWSPIVNLMCHRGAKPIWNDALAAFTPPDVGGGFVAAGSANGTMTLSKCLAEGARKGAEAAAALGFKAAKPALPAAADEDFAIAPLWRVKESKTKAFVDFQNDTTAKDLPLAAREGYDDIELAKRYTTTGMATDQGKLGNVNAIAIVAEATGRTIAGTGTTTFRPFYTPVSFGALAGPFVGHHFQPVRKTPLHDWAVEHGAEFVETGLWMR